MNAALAPIEFDSPPPRSGPRPWYAPLSTLATAQPRTALDYSRRPAHAVVVVDGDVVPALRVLRRRLVASGVAGLLRRGSRLHAAYTRGQRRRAKADRARRRVLKRMARARWWDANEERRGR